MATRRQLLGGIAGFVALSLSGCVSSPDSATPVNSETASPTSTAEQSTTVDNPGIPENPSECVPHWQEKPVRGEASGLQANHTLDSESPTGETLRRDCPYVAAEYTFERITERLGETEMVVVSPQYAGDLRGSSELAVGSDEFVVHVRRVFDASGECLQDHDQSFDPLRAATPRTARVTVQSEDGNHTCRLPVYLSDEMDHPL